MYKGGTMYATLPVAFHSDSKNVYKTANNGLLFTVSSYSWNGWWKTSHSHITEIYSEYASVI